MRTVPTLLASGTGIGLSAVGLVVVRSESRDGTPPPPTADLDMSAVTTYTFNTSTAATTTASTSPGSLLALSRPSSRRRFVSGEKEDGTARPSSVRSGRKRRSLTPRAYSQTVMDPPPLQNEDLPLEQDSPSVPSSTWLRRRWSRSLSTSRDSSRTPTSRPASATVSHSNGSVAFSHAGSTTPVFAANNSAPPPPNKLVKRSSSLRSANGSGHHSSGSRLPLPVFRRPATSHQRTATLHNRLSSSDREDTFHLPDDSTEARDWQWQQYFTPRIAVDSSPFARRRSSTAIPNPIKRVYPDRRYTPTLVSAKTFIKQAALELDDGLSESEDDIAVTKLRMVPSVASSPLAMHTSHFFEESPEPRRSFSINDLLSPGPHQLWRRPTSRGSRASLTKPSHFGRPRVASAPLRHMGSQFSSEDGPPAKRRDLSDSHISSLARLSSSSNTLSDTPLYPDPEADADTDLVEPNHLTQYTPDQVSYAQTLPSQDQQRLPLGRPRTSFARNPRISASHSEITSTVGSDSERLSFGDSSTDYQSDAAFDSIPTRTTRSSSGRRGPHIEAIFDDSSPSLSSGRSIKLRDFLNDGPFPDSDHNAIYRHSTIEEEGSVLSTPVRSMRSKSVTSTPSARPNATPIFASSPPPVNIIPDPDDIDWDAPDDELDRGLGIHDSAPASPNGTDRGFGQGLQFRFGPALRFGGTLSANVTPSRGGGSPPDRTNLFDWSEQQPSPSHPNHSPPRPRTVHGKKDQDRRVSRAAGRRPPSGMHARSHSVPIVPDVDGKRSNVVVNKFGTWGVGSKAVTEDWNDDFDFDHPPPTHGDEVAQDERRIDSGHEMFVPRLIREQQENVVANIELLREWGLLIEELKELRIRAVALDMLHGPFAQAWREVDAMIELADQETEEQTLDPRRSPPSSPGFDFNAFDDFHQSDSSATNERQDSFRRASDAGGASPNRPHAVFGANPQPSTPTSTRPRKDSELVAQSVIAALQAKRISGTAGVTANSPSRKVPFDTATLRHIVPYVNGLTRRVKNALRETEGLHLTPRRRGSPDADRRTHSSNGKPSIRSLLSYTFNDNDDDDDLPAKRRPRRDAAALEPEANEEKEDHDGHLAAQMQKMSLPVSRKP